MTLRKDFVTKDAQSLLHVISNSFNLINNMKLFASFLRFRHLELICMCDCWYC